MDKTNQFIRPKTAVTQRRKPLQYVLHGYRPPVTRREALEPTRGKRNSSFQSNGRERPADATVVDDPDPKAAWTRAP
jgi:hypothetical protein